MEVIKPKVRTLTSEKDLIAKEMGGKDGNLLLLHSSNLESVIFIHVGECVLNMANEEIQMKPGDVMIIPPQVKHQFKGITDFKGIHFMPKEIEFEFFK